MHIETEIDLLVTRLFGLETERLIAAGLDRADAAQTANITVTNALLALAKAHRRSAINRTNKKSTQNAEYRSTPRRQRRNSSQNA